MGTDHGEVVGVSTNAFWIALCAFMAIGTGVRAGLDGGWLSIVAACCWSACFGMHVTEPTIRRLEAQLLTRKDRDDD